MRIEQLKTEIEMLSEKDFIRLRQWFADKDWERWDQEIEADVALSKLDFLIEEEIKAKQEKTLKEL